MIVRINEALESVGCSTVGRQQAATCCKLWTNKPLSLFAYNQFKDSVGNSDYKVLDVRMISEQRVDNY
jgi:hypothetical protein